MSSKNEICIHTCVAIISRKEVTQIPLENKCLYLLHFIPDSWERFNPTSKNTEIYAFFFANCNILFLKLLYIIIIINMFFFYLFKLQLHTLYLILFL